MRDDLGVQGLAAVLGCGDFSIVFGMGGDDFPCPCALGAGDPLLNPCCLVLPESLGGNGNGVLLQESAQGGLWNITTLGKGREGDGLPPAGARDVANGLGRGG